MSNDREYRVIQTLGIEVREAEEPTYIVEGYASTFEPYVLYDDGVNVINERIMPDAFNMADMTDVIMQYDHKGRVFARQSNGTLQLSIDGHGLKIRADLSKTQLARDLYEDIKVGNINQMSFAFTVADDHYDKDTRTRVIEKIRKVYDVSAVSIPANPGTDIGVTARSFVDGVIDGERAERLEREKQLALLKLKLNLKEGQ